MCLTNSVLALAGPVIRTAPDPATAFSDGLKVIFDLLAHVHSQSSWLYGEKYYRFDRGDADADRWTSVDKMENAGFAVVDPK